MIIVTPWTNAKGVCFLIEISSDRFHTRHMKLHNLALNLHKNNNINRDHACEISYDFFTQIWQTAYHNKQEFLSNGVWYSSV